MNSLTAFFADLGDIRHEAEFVIFDTGALQPGTRIVSSAPDAKGSHLEIITDKGQGIWQAEWHDKTGKSDNWAQWVRAQWFDCFPLWCC